MQASVTEPSDDLRNAGCDYMAPRSPEEEARRAYFLVKEILCRCEEFERELSEKADITATAAGDSGRAGAIKLLAVGLLYLAALESGSGELRPWVMDYFFSAYKILDQIYPAPGSENLIAEFGALKTDALTKELSGRLSRAFGTNKIITERVFAKFVSNQIPLLPDLVLTSLTMPLLMLRDLVQLFDSTGLAKE